MSLIYICSSRRINGARSRRRKGTGKEREGLRGLAELGKLKEETKARTFKGKEPFAPKHSGFEPARSDLKLEINRRFPGSP